MSTYLLTWNPNKWGFEEYKNYYLEYKKGRILRWSCGTTKKLILGIQFIY